MRMATVRGGDEQVSAGFNVISIQRPPWVPAYRFDELQREALQAAEEEDRRKAYQRCRGRRMSGAVAVVVGVGSFVTALWMQEGGVIISMTALLVLAGIAAMRPRAPNIADVRQSVARHFAFALESYRREQLESSDFFHCEAWQALRRSVLERGGARCRRCGRKASAMLVVEHIVSRDVAPERALDPENVEILCHACRNAPTFVMRTGTA